MLDQTVLRDFPLPIAASFQSLRDAQDDDARYQATLLLFDRLVQWAAILGVAPYLQGPKKDFGVDLTLAGLRRPSLGDWNGIIRQICDLDEQGPKLDIFERLRSFYRDEELASPDVRRAFEVMRETRMGGDVTIAEALTPESFLEEYAAFRESLKDDVADPKTQKRLQGPLAASAYELLERATMLNDLTLAVVQTIRDEGEIAQVLHLKGPQPISDRKAQPIGLAGVEVECGKVYLYGPGHPPTFIPLDPFVTSHDDDVYVLDCVSVEDNVTEYTSLSSDTGRLKKPGEAHEIFTSSGTKTAHRDPDGTRLEDAGPPDRVLVENFQVIRRIGAGAMGVVYEARQRSLNRNVALKVLPSEFSMDPKRLERFKREAYALAAVNHPNIVTIHDITQIGGQSLICMEYVEGESLSKLIDDVGPMTPRQATRIGVQICAALDLLHERGILHRDIKPSNIMVTAQGVAKLLDFGIAKSTHDADMTHKGAIIGTPAFMSPEQRAGLDLDLRSDLYSLGVCLYVSLTGESPSAADWKPVPLHKKRADLPTGLAKAIMRTLETSPDKRFESAAEFRRALELTPKKGNPLLVAAVALVVLLAAGVGAWQLGFLDGFLPKDPVQPEDAIAKGPLELDNLVVRSGAGALRPGDEHHEFFTQHASLILEFDRPATALDSFTVNGRQVLIDADGMKGRIDNLEQGRNELIVEKTDETFEIILDTHRPNVKVFDQETDLEIREDQDRTHRVETMSPTVNLRVRVQDEYLDEVNFRKQPVRLENGDFSFSVPLEPGESKIEELVAIDKAGLKRTVRFELSRTTLPPLVVTVQGASRAAQGPWLIARDRAVLDIQLEQPGLTPFVSVDGIEQLGSETATGHFVLEVPLQPSQSGQVYVVKVKDDSGRPVDVREEISIRSVPSLTATIAPSDRSDLKDLVKALPEEGHFRTRHDRPLIVVDVNDAVYLEGTVRATCRNLPIDASRIKKSEEAPNRIEIEPDLSVGDNLVEVFLPEVLGQTQTLEIHFQQLSPPSASAVRWMGGLVELEGQSLTRENTLTLNGFATEGVTQVEVRRKIDGGHEEPIMAQLAADRSFRVDVPLQEDGSYDFEIILNDGFGDPSVLPVEGTVVRKTQEPEFETDIPTELTVWNIPSFRFEGRVKKALENGIELQASFDGSPSRGVTLDEGGGFELAHSIRKKTSDLVITATDRLGNQHGPVTVKIHFELPEPLDFQGGRILNTQDGAELVFLPDAGQDQAEKPRGLFVYLHEVSNENYRKFVDARGYDTDDYWTSTGTKFRNRHRWRQPKQWSGSPDPAHPVAGISSLEAEAYCKWAGVEVPTVRDWLRAGGLDQQTFPWGDRWEPSRVVFGRASMNDVVATTSLPDGAAPSGCLHMIGNVAEWCHDGRNRVLMGGSCQSTESELSSGPHSQTAAQADYRPPFAGLRPILRSR